jgi:hypothetical protein
VLVEELDGLQETNGFVNGAPDGQVVNGGRSNDALRVHDEEAAESDGVVMKDTELACDGLVQVGNKGQMARGEATLVARLLRPGQVAVLGVDADAVDFGTELAELGDAVAESIQLRGAYKSALRNKKIINRTIQDSTQ